MADGSTSSDQPEQRRGPWLDVLAVGASAVCLLHCLALPLVFAALPTLAAAFDMPPAFHVWLIALTVPLSSIALWRGWIIHHSRQAIQMASIGALALIAAVLGAEGTFGETLLTVMGSLLIARAHIVNWRARSCSPRIRNSAATQAAS